MPNARLSGIWSVRYRNEQDCQCHKQSGTGRRGPSPVPECFGRLRYWMPEWRCRRHRPRCRRPAMVKTNQGICKEVGITPGIIFFNFLLALAEASCVTSWKRDCIQRKTWWMGHNPRVDYYLLLTLSHSQLHSQLSTPTTKGVGWGGEDLTIGWAHLYKGRVESWPFVCE